MCHASLARPTPSPPEQLFNMVNARKVQNELNVFQGLFASHVFWVVWVIIVGFQVGRGGGSACCMTADAQLCAPAAPCGKRLPF